MRLCAATTDTLPIVATGCPGGLFPGVGGTTATNTIRMEAFANPPPVPSVGVE